VNESGSAGYGAVISPVSELHQDVVDCGTVIQEAIAGNIGGIGEGFRLSDAAIGMMVVDCLAIHGAIRDACAAGWAIVAPMLLRTQLELLLGCAVIANAGDRSELLAYKYYFLSTKAILRTPKLPQDKRKRQKGQSEKFLEFLPQGDRAEARDFIRKGKIESYWYSPDYGGPQDVIERIGSEDVKILYRSFSGGAHGGTLGIRSWRDTPDLEHPAPRRDPSAQSLAVSGSNAIAMQLLRLRFGHLGVPVEPVFDKLLAQHNANRPLVEDLFRNAMQGAREYVEKRDRHNGGQG